MYDWAHKTIAVFVKQSTQETTGVTHAIVREAPGEGNALPHHLLEEVLLVQKHEDRSVLENRVSDHVFEQLQAFVHPAAAVG